MAHINELYDYTVSIFIVNGAGQVLMVNHPRYGKWIPVGGHIELNEDPEQALYREVQEETGLDVEILSTRPQASSPETKFLITPNYVDVHEANPPHKHISFIYFAATKDDNFVMSSEHEDMKWFTPQDLEAEAYALTPAVKFYANEAIKLASS
jgi:8-oxo-dGTP pyrophosphatase MutT (NUDIX family)